jgi:serine/threonine protein phosphatase 1
MRTIAIGDIHGCSLALSVLLEQIRPAREDRIIFLGDYVDRGANSRNVIEQILSLQQHCEVITLLGNHEVLLQSARESPEPNDFWLQQCGGNETLISYGGSFADIPESHWEFVRNCRRYYETERHFFVHANYVPDQPIAEQPEQMALWQHLTTFTPMEHQSGKIAVVGHTPQRTGNILNIGHLICLDTGCFLGGWLTALDIESGQVWQVSKYGEVRSLAAENP